MILLVLVALLFGCTAAVAAQLPHASVSECAANQLEDKDNDGITTECELALARIFSPLLRVRSGGCNWDTSRSPPRPGGGYFYAVQSVNLALRIAYLPAYFKDCGWTGAKCWLPWVDCSPHDGDSEFIVVEVRRGADVTDYSVTGVFLSAHCFGRSSASCRWYRANDLEHFEWSGMAPVIWVAEGRNGNYLSQEACNHGHYTLDSCEHHDYSYRFPIEPDRNIGSRHKPARVEGCVSGADLHDSRVYAEAVECFWRSEPFRGWQTGAQGVTGYFKYLAEIAQF